MNVSELIALAKIRSGKAQKVMAAEMGHKNPHRISRIGTGQLEADASEIVYLAHEAKLPEVQTLAEIESERNPALANMWKLILTSGSASLIR